MTGTVKIFSSILPPDETIESKVSAELQVSGISQSTADIRPGDVFFAIAGHRADGHAFVSDALSKGAAAIVVEREDVFRELPNAALVSSTRRSLGLSASRWFDRPTARFKLVGVTGTNGKTTTTYLLRHVWRQAGRQAGVVGTVECLIGDTRVSSTLTTPDPLVLQRLFADMVAAGVTHTAMEVSSIALDQYRVAGCDFRVGVFTNLTQDHLDYHGDFETYFRAKRRLFEEYSPLAAVINIDDEWGKRLRSEVSVPRCWTISMGSPSADFYVKEASFGAGVTRAVIGGALGDLVMDLPLIGKHNLYNALGVLGVVAALDDNVIEASKSLGSAVGAPGRLERVVGGADLPYVFVDYAHTDDALKNVLQSLKELKKDSPGRIITVFGCGGDRDRNKRPKMAEVVSALSDVTIVTSDNPRTEKPLAIIGDIEPGIDRESTEYYREVDRRQAIGLALSLARPRDLVLVAGKGHETYQIVGTEKFPFDDREVIRDYYEKR